MKPVLLQCKEWLAKNALLPYYGVLDSQGPCCILTTTKCRSDARRQLHKKLRHNRQNGIFELDSSSWSLQFFNAISDSKKTSCLLLHFDWIAVDRSSRALNDCIITNPLAFLEYFGKYFYFLFLAFLSLHLTFVTWIEENKLIFLGLRNTRHFFSLGFYFAFFRRNAELWILQEKKILNCLWRNHTHVVS